MPKLAGPDLRTVLDAARREGPSPYLKGIVKALEEADRGLQQHYNFVRLQKQQAEKRRKRNEP